MNIKLIHNYCLFGAIVLLFFVGIFQEPSSKLKYLNKRKSAHKDIINKQKQKLHLHKMVILDSGINLNIANPYNRQPAHQSNLDSHNHGTRVFSVVKSKNDYVHIKNIPIHNFLDDKLVRNQFIRAVQENPRIIICAFSGDDFLKGNEDILKQAYKQGTIIVAAAGNKGKNTFFQKTYPANYQYPNIISVMSVNRSNHKSTFSNYGKNIFIGALGEKLESIDMNNNYKPFTGTSASTAYVGALISAALSINPKLNYRRIKKLLSMSSDYHTQLRNHNKVSGVVNEKVFLKMVRSTSVE